MVYNNKTTSFTEIPNRLPQPTIQKNDRTLPPKSIDLEGGPEWCDSPLSWVATTPPRNFKSKNFKDFSPFDRHRSKHNLCLSSEVLLFNNDFLDKIVVEKGKVHVQSFDFILFLLKKRINEEFKSRNSNNAFSLKKHLKWFRERKKRIELFGNNSKVKAFKRILRLNVYY